MRSLKKTLNRLACYSGFIKRKRHLTAKDFLILMTIGQMSLKLPSLAAMVDGIQAQISRQALHYRFNKEAVEFMLACSKFVLKHKIDSIYPLKSQSLKLFKRIMIADSSGWDVNPRLKDILPGYGGSASSAHCKVQIIYEYKKGEMNFFDLTPGTRPDHDYSGNLPSHVQAKDLWIIDLGYFCLKTFAQIAKAGACFLSRFLVGTGIFDPVSGKPIQLEKLLRNQKGNAYELEVMMGTLNQTRTACRLIALRVSQEVADKRRQKLYKEARKKGRTPNKHHLIMCAWTLMVTNASENMLPSRMVREFYALRWQIELLFKQLKSVLGIDYSNTGNENRLRCEVYGKIIIAILIHRIHAFHNARIWNTKRKELSMDKLYKRIQERAIMLMYYILHSIMRAALYLKEEIPRLIKNCMKSQQLSRKTSLEKLENGVSLYKTVRKIKALT